MASIFLVQPVWHTKMMTLEYPDYSTLVWTENIGYKNKSFILLEESIIKKKKSEHWVT